MRALYLRMPAVATLVLVVGAGYIIGGIRSALAVGMLTLFIPRNSTLVTRDIICKLILNDRYIFFKS